MVGRICAVLVLWWPFWVEAATARVPLKPADGIYDQEGWLEGESRAEMVRRILGAREKGEVSVFVVILPERSEEVDQLAARWGREWGEGGLWGMVLHATGEDGFPRYYSELSQLPGWSEEQKREFEKSLQKALEKVSANARLVGKERQRVEAGTREMANELGYLGLLMARIDLHNAQARGDRVEKAGGNPREKETSLWWQIGVPVLIVVVGLLFYLIFKTGEEEPGEGILFPETKPQKRFRAPWSGGGNVLVKFGRDRR